MADLSTPTNDGQSEQTSDNLITQHIDIWTTAIEQKSSAGRGTSNKFSLYGIKKLRELILELAVRGKLVPQDVNDEPASVLLKRIAAEKAQLVKEGKIKKPITLPEINDDEKPFELPTGWDWTNFINLLDFSGGGQPPKSYFSEEMKDGYVQLIQIRDLGPRPQPVFIPKEKASKFCTSKDVMVGRYGASVGKVFWGKEGAYNVALIKIHNDQEAFLPEFVHLLLRSPLGQSFFSGISRSAQDGFSKNDIAHKLIPVLCTEEQHRIVAKVDELMSLCDALEAQTEASISAHQTLVETLLNALLQPNTSQAADSQSASTEPSFADSPVPALSDSFVDSWQRVAEHFDTLFTTEASIDTLKQTILQLAVMGKLVQQDPNDEPAVKLLARIAKEKAQLIKDGKIKKQKTLHAITDEEKPFALPQGWEWVRFGSLVNFQAELVRPEEFLDYDQIAPDSIEKGTGKLLKRRTVRDSGVKGPNSRFYTGQILYSKIRPSLSKAVIAEFDGLCSADMYPLQSMVYSKYLLKSILSEVFLEQVRVAENRIKMPKLNIDSLSDIMLPLAPIEEQHCIVTKVDELMALCDQLKARLSDAQTTQLHLTDAIVEQAV
tara:strand:+ start:631 stop:2445 length:1815 start_codon:yes stop_codon:yes gene_type:complete